MANVTTSWTNITSANVSLTGGFTMTLYLDARYLSQDTATNTTTRETRLRSVITNGYASGSGYEFTLTDADTLSGSAVWNFKTETILTGSGDVAHNADGTKTETITATAKNTYLGINETLSGSATYPTIARASTVSCRESVPIGAVYTTITVNRASESFTHTLEIIVDGTVQETFSNVTDSYRWMPSAQTYNQLTPNSKELDATIRCTTYSGSTQIGSPTTLAVTLVVSSSYAPNLADTTATVPSPCLMGVSTVTVSIPGANIIPANSYATIASVTVKSGEKSYSVISTGNNNRISSLTRVLVSNVTVTVTDSRGYKTSKNLSWILVPYVPVTVTGTFSRASATSSSVTIVITGNYYNTSLYSNTLSLRVQGTNAGGSIDNTYTSGITYNSTKNTYSKSVTLTGFTYSENYALTLTATDNVGSATYTLTVSQSQPAFSVGKVNGKNHFDVHGDLRIVSTSDPSDGRVLNGFVFQTSWSSGTHDLDDAPNGLTWINWNNATVTSANTIPFNSGYGFLFQAGNRFQMYVKHGTAGIQGMWVRDYTTDSTSHWFAWTQIGGGSSPSYVNGDEVSY